MSARVIQVIYTDMQHRGTGRSEDDPFRILTQLWTLDGKLIFEYDPATDEAVRGPGLSQVQEEAEE